MEIRNWKLENRALRILEGYLIPKTDHVIFRSDEGGEIVFQGVRISTSMVVKNSAYQLNGIIYISKNWIKGGFSIQDFTHEYGHYLQQQEMGLFKYLRKVALPSIFSLLTKPKTHYHRPFERDATNKGNEYRNRYV